MAYIKDVVAREILDSRGIPTVETEVILTNGIVGWGRVPSGASTGSHEALELRDGGARFMGKGVLQAVNNVQNQIRPLIVGRSPLEQLDIDHAMIKLDGTTNKAKLGANAILSVSMAVAHAAAKLEEQDLFAYLHRIYNSASPLRLPVPMMNVINGGKHADNKLEIQEFMIVPHGAPTFKEALRYGVEVFNALKGLLHKQGFQTSVGDEGGFAPQIKNNRAVLDLLLQAIETAGLRAGKDVSLAIDAAANEFYANETYNFHSENLQLTSEELVEYFAKLVTDYPIVSLEDALAEDDWPGWKSLTKRLGDKTQLVGDDIFVTNTTLLQRGIEEHIANAILIKMNQIGTLSETFATMHMAQAANYECIVSHRSGETCDATIADLAVATNAGQIKTGSLSRSERLCKYNQLLRIEERLGSGAKFAGSAVYKRR